MYDSILVPTDGSDHAVRAALHAEYLADAFEATVSLLNVVDVDAEAGPFSAGGVGDDFLDRLEADGRDTIRETERAIDAAAGRTEVVVGRPAETILDHTDQHGVDLVVMGTQGRTGLPRYVVGSVAERVLALAETPVITTRATDGDQPVEGYDEILAPTDGSEAASEAVDHAVAVAEQSGGRVHAVHVVDVGAVAGGGITMPSEVLTELDSAGEAAAERVTARVRDAGLDAVSAVREGRPAETLVNYADEHDIDLIAMGTVGRTGLSRFLLGSTTEKVVRHADPPVLAVEPQRE